ncbi:hypothetical protein BZL30_5029 [Mycobacterium kansasii]|uniref:Uncharacterized protein n=1 Tax=Mycobacterium kansasii TaxID=1768 RepID=A0A1V3X514_MYCKA|nr:hypothetical protein BZL30_5029 [Mycobacterium kansasii]
MGFALWAVRASTGRIPAARTAETVKRSILIDGGYPGGCFRPAAKPSRCQPGRPRR